MKKYKMKNVWKITSNISNYKNFKIKKKYFVQTSYKINNFFLMNILQPNNFYNSNITLYKTVIYI